MPLPPRPALPTDPFTLAALLLATDPEGLGGAILEGPAGPAPEAWLRTLRALLPDRAPWRRIPAGVTGDRLVGGIDLAGTLSAGRRVLQPGLLAEASGGTVLLPSAERLGPEVTAPLLEASDRRRIRVEREGISADLPASVMVIGLDESRSDEPGAPEALRDRVAFLLRLPPRWTPTPHGWDRHSVGAARGCLPGTELPDGVLRDLTVQSTRGESSPPSLRPLVFALRAARTLSALDPDGRGDPQALAALAGALVLAPRGCPPLPSPSPPEDPAARSAPKDPADDEASPGSPPPPPDPPTVRARAENEAGAPTSRSDPPGGTAEGSEPGDGPDAASVLRVFLPPGFLDEPQRRGRSVRAIPGSRGAGAQTRSHERGRRIGAEPGPPGRGRRLDLPATLRAAAPWQRLREREERARTPEAPETAEGRGGTPPHRPPRLRIRRPDLRVQRRVRTAARRTIFLVDASGSQALRRLGEVKGAAELLLADAYRRREEVALVVFRDREARVILPPTRSLTRAKRLLRGLVGGGGTPLALGLMAAEALALEGLRAGTEPRILLLSDGRPNVDRHGRGGRARARLDALSMGRHLESAGIPVRVLDTSARGEPFLQELAVCLGTVARHLPYADARGIRAAASTPEPPR